jgi:hypothetical protein
MLSQFDIRPLHHSQSEIPPHHQTRHSAIELQWKDDLIACGFWGFMPTAGLLNFRAIISMPQGLNLAGYS